MPCTVIEDETANKFGFRRSSMLHLHDLDHVEIDRLAPLIFGIYTRRLRSAQHSDDTQTARTCGWWWWPDGQHRIHNVGSQLLRERAVDFGRERRVCDVDERRAIERDRLLERV